MLVLGDVLTLSSPKYPFRAKRDAFKVRGNGESDRIGRGRKREECSFRFRKQNQMGYS
jgi:hypothetical protein